MHDVVKRYRGFEIHWPVGGPGLAVKHPSGELPACEGQVFASFSRAEKFIDRLIEQFRLDKPPTQ